MALERTEALVLRSIKFGDTSKILTFLSRDFGTIKVIAKGVRAVRPRFGAALEPFARIDLVYYRKNNRDMHLLSQADLIEGYLPLSDDVRRYAFGCAVTEFAARVVSGEGESPVQFDETAAALELVASAPREALPYVLRAFEMRLVSSLGHTPELFRCVDCGREDRPVAAFSPFAGGTVCGECLPAATGTMTVSTPALAVLRSYRDDPLAAAAGLTLTPAVRAEVGRLMEAFLAAQFDSYRGLKSVKLAAGLGV